MAAPPETEIDVAIVGGGPAGLAAAIRLRARGSGRVVVLEREESAGGVPRHCGHYPFGMREFARVLRGPDYAKRLVARALAAGVEIRTRASVVAIEAGPRLLLSTPDGVATLEPRRVLLATGVRETSRAARFVGGDRVAGVMSTGALQALVYLHGRTPFVRPVIVGTELVSFSALLTCRHAGIRPAAMIEAGPRPTAFAAARLLPAALGIPLHFSSEILRIVGEERVSGVVVRRADGREETIAADGVIVSGRFTPEAALARMGGLAVDPTTGGPVVDQAGRTSDPAIYAAGNLLRPVETAGWSFDEGRRIADAIADDLAGSAAAAPALAVSLGSDALAWAMPQRLAPATPHGLDALQLRVARPVRGRLVARAGERVVWSGRIASRPERRILVPLAPLAAAGAPIELRIEEA